MPNYRRVWVPGGTYFFTVTLQDRHSDLLVREVALLRRVVAATRERHPFQIDAWVVLPEHMHCLWTLPAGDVNFARRWRAIKSNFCKGVAQGEPRTLAQRLRGQRGIWQRGYWEHLICDAEDFQRHFDYVHINPVKHGWVSEVKDWPYSSFHRAVAQGIYPLNWAGDENELPVGERP